MRDMVIELGRRVRQACAEEIERIAEGNSFPELFDVPNDQSTLEAPPEPPDLNDPAAVGLWRDGLIRQSFEAGEQRGLERGLEKGREEGRMEGRARALLDVLRHRGLSLTSEQERRLLQCRDENTLEKWWSCVFTVSSVEELDG
jgi:flagellar biosynthesis/type III secretory pathway protein FliH